MIRRYDCAALIKFARALLVRAGLPPAPARDVAEVLVEGDLLGKTTHGLNLLPRYLQEIADGRMTRGGAPKILKKSAATLLLDGRYLPGPHVVRRAIAWARPRAWAHGVATVSIRRSHHIGCLQAYLQPLTERGLIVLLYCADPANTSVAPTGGMRGVYSPDPLAAGFPTGGAPILIDTTTASVSLGQALRLRAKGEKFSSAALQSARGEPTNDPAVLFAQPPGTILPLGGIALGHKGFAFAVLVEALSCALAGHGRADRPGRWGASIFLQIIDPKFFGGAAAFKRETRWFAQACRASPARPGVEKVRLPGEAALARRREQLKRGVELPADILRALEPWAEKLGVKPPSALGIRRG